MAPSYCKITFGHGMEREGRQMEDPGAVLEQGREMNAILTEAEYRLRSLSRKRLRVANDFLAY